MALHVTQCPSCESTFNTSAQMLEAARGRVRCGACLSVFAANENFVTTLADASNDELATGESNSVFISPQVDYFDPATFFSRSELQRPAESPVDLDLIPQDEPHIDEEFFNEDVPFHSPVDLDLIPQDEPQIDEEFLNEDGLFHNDDAADFEFLPEVDSQFDDQVEDQEWTIQATFVVSPSVALQPEKESEEPAVEIPEETELSVEDEAEAEFFRLLEVVENAEDHTAAPESDFSLAPEANETAPTPANETDEPVFDDLLLDEDPAWSPRTEQHNAPTGIVAPLQAPNLAELAPSAKLAVPESKDAILARLKTSRLREIDDEIVPLSRENLAALSAVNSSLELEVRKRPLNIKRLAGFSTAIIVLGLLLIGQFYWQRMEILSLDPRLRPWYEAACRVVGCELAALQNLASIQTENLVIRSHPEIPGSLVVTAVFRNLASFQQPFPIIELRFSDLDNQAVASRAFLPAEYLAPQLRSIVNMPVGSPVQITLEILDPGEDAVNYSLNFLPLQPGP